MHADTIIYGTLSVIAVLVGALIWWGIRLRRKDDAQSRVLTAEQVRALTAADRVGDRFLWCTWQDRLSATAFTLHIRDEQGAELTRATKHFVPQDGARITYGFEGEPRRCVAESLVSNRTLLLARDSIPALMACAHTTIELRLLGRDLHTERVRVGPLSLRTSERTITQENRAVGKLFMVKQLDFQVLVLSLLPEVLTPEEQLFLLVTAAGG